MPLSRCGGNPARSHATAQRQGGNHSFSFALLCQWMIGLHLGRRMGMASNGHLHSNITGGQRTWNFFKNAVKDGAIGGHFGVDLVVPFFLDRSFFIGNCLRKSEDCRTETHLQGCMLVGERFHQAAKLHWLQTLFQAWVAPSHPKAGTGDKKSSTQRDDPEFKAKLFKQKWSNILWI